MLSPRRKPQLEQGLGPTAERLAKAKGDYVQGRDARGRETGILTMRDAPLERALSQNVITTIQYNAGIKYRHHHHYAGLDDSIGSIDLDRISSADPNSFSGMAKTEVQAFHRQRYRAAVEVLGRIGEFVVQAVVCRDQSLEYVGYKLGWDVRSQAIAAATERLRSALDDLVKLWGL